MVGGKHKKFTLYPALAIVFIQASFPCARLSQLKEECDNMAREGLRTLVFGQKSMSEAEYKEFSQKYNAA